MLFFLPVSGFLQTCNPRHSSSDLACARPPSPRGKVRAYGANGATNANLEGRGEAPRPWFLESVAGGQQPLQSGVGLFIGKQGGETLIDHQSLQTPLQAIFIRQDAEAIAFPMSAIPVAGADTVSRWWWKRLPS